MDKIFKKYPKNYSSFRRKWANLYRPMKKPNFLQPTVIIMFVLFILSFIGFMLDVPCHTTPFIGGFLFVLISIYYFRLFPLTWDEMYEYEKKYYRELWGFPTDWNPQSK